MKFLFTLLSCLVIAGCVMAVHPVKVDAVFPGYNGKIVFYSNRDGNNEIYVMDSKGGSIMQLTDDEWNDAHPRWSPDGSKIMYHSNRDGLDRIIIMNADGTDKSSIGNLNFYNNQADWSPDGSKVAFTSIREGEFDIYVMDSDGGNEFQLTTNIGRDNNPSWSPNGKMIAFQSRRNGATTNDIYVMNADGSEQTRLTHSSHGAGGPIWSPDSEWIIYNDVVDGVSAIFRMRPDGTEKAQLTNSTANHWPFSYSPDGKKLIIGSDIDGDQVLDDREMYLMGFSDSNIERLSFNDELDWEADWQAITNVKPVTSIDTLTVFKNNTKSIDVLSNDSDEEALNSQYLTIKSQPANGAAKVVNGKVEYSPKNDFAGKDELTYQICDSFLLDQKCATGVLSITVQAGPKPPAPEIHTVGIVELNGSDKVYYTSNKPTFSGTAEPFATVKIEIHSDPIILTTTADADGNWSVTPDQDIPNGEHSVKIISIKDGAASDPVSFVLGINVGLAETGNPLWPIIIVGVMGLVSGGLYVRRRVNE